MLAGIGCVILYNVVAVYGPVLVRQGLDEALYHSRVAGMAGKSGLTNTYLNVALGFAVLIILAAIVKGIFMYLMRQTIIVVSRYVEYDLKNDLYNRFQNLGLAFYRRNFTGDMMARIGEDVSNVRMYIGPAVMYFVNLLFAFIMVIYQMFHVNAQLTVYVLLPLPLLAWLIYLVSTLINKRTTLIQEQLSSISTAAQETFAGIRVIKAFGVEGWFRDFFHGQNSEYRRRNMKLALVNALFFPLMLLLVGFSTLLVLYLGGKAVFAGTFTPGNIAEFVLYLNMLIWPVASLGWTMALVQKAAASQKRINEFLIGAESAEKGGPEPFRLQDRISFKDLTFSYPGSPEPALKNITVEIPVSKLTGIIGRTGCGKTTLAQLLTRQWESPTGKIEFDGVDINEIALEDFRRRTAYVPQDVFLFSDTIAENIAFGLEKGVTDPERIRDAADKAGLTEDLRDFPNGLDTMLGERGVTLSGGQKQRVSIARALIRDAEFYVLDDCLSAVDAETEQRIIASFKTNLQGKTALIFSHRIQAIRHCDEIWVMDAGRIAERGTHEELLKKNGMYAKIQKLQSREEEAEETPALFS